MNGKCINCSSHYKVAMVPVHDVGFIHWKFGPQTNAIMITDHIQFGSTSSLMPVQPQLRNNADIWVSSGTNILLFIASSTSKPSIRYQIIRIIVSQLYLLIVITQSASHKPPAPIDDDGDHPDSTYDCCERCTFLLLAVRSGRRQRRPLCCLRCFLHSLMFDHNHQTIIPIIPGPNKC